MASIAPSERLRRELDEIVAGADEELDPIEAIGRLGARLILQQALEEELTEFLGRERYERAAGNEDARAGMRNGYCPTTVIILSRESDHAFDQGFSDEDSVVDAVLSMAR